MLFALMAFCFGFIRQAHADGNAYETEPENAVITKVIVAPEGYDTTGDTYIFSFKGAGTVADEGDSLKSDDVVQDQTLKVGDVVPSIDDYTMSGVGALSATNALASADGSLYQSTKSVSLKTILQNVTFPHAGIHTYEVRESQALKGTSDGTYINQSAATYILRIRVSNRDDGTGTNLGIDDVDWVTVAKTADDEGTPQDETKIDPTYPKANANGKITQESPSSTTAPDTLAGDSRGHDVYGFTFTNEYVGGGRVEVTKCIAGTHADKTRKFPFTITVTDNAAKDYPGCCITYTVTDASGANVVADRDQSGNVTVTGIANPQDYMASFNSDNQAIITVDLTDGDTFAITGLYGSQSSDLFDNDGDGTAEDNRLRFTDGLKEGTVVKVEETSSAGYTPKGYVFSNTTGGTAPTPSIQINANGTATVSNESAFTKKVNGTTSAINITDKVAKKGSSYFVVNSFDESKVSPTGIFVDNLPYIIMVGVPVAAFAISFVARRRAHTA